MRVIGAGALGLSVVNMVVGASIPRAVFILTVFMFLTVVNIRGVEAGVRLFMFNTLAKLIPLLLLLGAGLFAINMENLAIPEWPSAREVGAGAILLFFAFSGAECALSASGEIKNPSKTVPMGLSMGIGGLLVLYVGLQTVAQGVLGPELANQTEAPLAAAAVVCAFALSGTFRYLAVFATGSLLLIDLGVVLAVVRLRQRDGLPEAGQFRLPFGPLIPLLSCLIVGWLLLQVPAGEAMSIAGLIGASAIVYAIRPILASRSPSL